MSDIVEYDHAAMEADGDLADSEYENSLRTEANSIASCIEEYIEQNGRRYHTYFGPDKNPMPTDAKEQERLDITHEALLLASGGKLYQAPLDDEKIERVLDLGTGTGIWAIDFAQRFPLAQVLGTDLSPIQPGWVPKNCSFEVDDFELDWIYNKPFDFIHARTIAQSVNNWPRLLEQSFQHLRPGGILEIGEAIFEPRSDDGTMPPDWPPCRILALLQQALEQIGRQNPDGKQLKCMMEQAGFVDVRVKGFKIPMGTWPKRLDLKQAGTLIMVSIMNEGYVSYAQRLLVEALGMGEEEAAALCEEAKTCHVVSGMKVHVYLPFFSVYGRKPALPA